MKERDTLRVGNWPQRRKTMTWFSVPKYIIQGSWIIKVTSYLLLNWVTELFQVSWYQSSVYRKTLLNRGSPAALGKGINQEIILLGISFSQTTFPSPTYLSSPKSSQLQIHF